MGLREFVKMSGSGNDFLVFDARAAVPGDVPGPALIRALCARGTGVGADGVILIGQSAHADFRMTYFNSDGSRAEMCGNAALCVSRLAAELGLGSADRLRFDTDCGIVAARVLGRIAEVQLQAVTTVVRAAPIDTDRGEERIGFALAGVPHLVVLCQDADTIDAVTRGGALRRHPWQPNGANVNFISPAREPGPEPRWRIRTYERGVEAETLACGTGAVASAVLLEEWGKTAGETILVSRSGSPLTVRLQRSGMARLPLLSGEARKVFSGTLLEI